jgi:hypothetical protein
MRICPKCSKRVSGDSKICRDCGAILEDMPDESVPEVGVEPATPFGFPSASKHQEPVGEVMSESQEPTPPDLEAPPWKCPQCGELVPGTFDICWKCQTTKGEGIEQSEPVFFPEISDASRPNVESETAKFLKSLEVDQPEVPLSQSACPRCGSSKMMYGVTVQDQGEGSNRNLRVVICGDPSALIFKDRLYGELKANICGDCGHVELRVANPKELYRHYRRSNG